MNRSGMRRVCSGLRARLAIGQYWGRASVPTRVFSEAKPQKESEGFSDVPRRRRSQSIHGCICRKLVVVDVQKGRVLLRGKCSAVHSHAVSDELCLMMMLAWRRRH